jgi:hypothetical protein
VISETNQNGYSTENTQTKPIVKLVIHELSKFLRFLQKTKYFKIFFCLFYYLIQWSAVLQLKTDFSAITSERSLLSLNPVDRSFVAAH